jgi:hypothetical protein
MVLGGGEVVAMAGSEGVASFCVAEICRGVCGAEHEALSEEGAVATQITREEYKHSLTTTEVELSEGKHYWEVELLSTHR